MSTLTPPCSAATWPSSDVPAPNGTSGARWRAHTPTIAAGLLVLCGPHHRVGSRGRMKRLVEAVLLAHVAAREHAVGAQERAQVVEKLRGGGVGQARALL